MSTRLVLASTLALAAACAAPQPPAPLDLRAATGQADVRVTGVAVDPAGARYVFDDGSGLYQIGADGGFELALARAAMPDPGVPVAGPFTDLVAIGPGRFVITSRDQGFVLDLAGGTLRPAFSDGPAQRTDAVAYDPEAALLYTQPRTFDAGGNPRGSQLASHALATGADVERFAVTGDVAAGGMAKLPGTAGLLLGVGAALCSLVRDDVTEIVGLTSVGIVRIDGLAVDRAAGTLLIVDGDRDQLLELDLADLVP